MSDPGPIQLGVPPDCNASANKPCINIFECGPRMLLSSNRTLPVQTLELLFYILFKLRIFCAVNAHNQQKSRGITKEASQETRTPSGFRARRNQHSPKSNRMPDAPHSVTVV